jgi:hypothetical protein
MSLSLANAIVPDKLPCAISFCSNRHFSNEYVFVAGKTERPGAAAAPKDGMSRACSREARLGSDQVWACLREFAPCVFCEQGIPEVAASVGVGPRSSELMLYLHPVLSGAVAARARGPDWPTQCCYQCRCTCCCQTFQSLLRRLPPTLPLSLPPSPAKEAKRAAKLVAKAEEGEAKAVERWTVRLMKTSLPRLLDEHYGSLHRKRSRALPQPQALQPLALSAPFEKSRRFDAPKLERGARGKEKQSLDSALPCLPSPGVLFLVQQGRSNPVRVDAHRLPHLPLMVRKF